MSKTKTILRDVGFYSSSLIVTQIITVLAAVLMRRFLGPVQVGVWAFIQVVLNYAEYAAFGTVAAMALEIPFFAGKGEPEKAEAVKNTAFTFSLISSLALAVGVLLYALVCRPVLEQRFFYALLFASGLVILQRLNGFLVTLLRAYKHFTLAGRQMFYSAAVNALLIAVLSFHFQLYGFMTAMLLSFVFNIGFILGKQLFSFRFFFDAGCLRSLIGYGFPLMVIALLGTFFETIDRVMITRYLGFEALGFYSIAMMAYTYLNSIPNAIGIVIIPNIQEKFGETGRRHELKGYLEKAQMSLSALMPVLIGISWFVVPYLVERVLPKFVPGLDAMRFLILGAYFLALAQVYSQFVYVIRKHLALLPLVAASCFLAALFNWVAIRRGAGIQGVAAATTLAMFFNFTMVHAFASKQVYTLKEYAGSYFLALWKFFFLVGVLLAVTAWVHAPGELGTAALRTSVFILLYLPFLWQVDRRLGIFEMLRKKFSKKERTAIV